MEQNIAIMGIGTALPPYRMVQSDTARRLADALQDRPDSARWARRLFKQCGVDTRYTCEPDLLEEAGICRYFPRGLTENAPTTAERMAVYKRESVPLALSAARQALADSRVDVSDITHLITVSCTGQFLPGLDTILLRELELNESVVRLPLTFIGCAAGLKAVGLAKQLVTGQPQAKALIVCVELCTLHIQPSGDRDALFGASFFGDGASSCVIGTAGAEHGPLFRLGASRSVLLPGGTEEMVWEVGNYGFDLYLSPHIPKLIAKWVPSELERLCGEEQPQLWAVHPGGKGIIETLQAEYKLTDAQIAPSLDVLRRIGNVSSATILFVLLEMRSQLQRQSSGQSSGLALAFGPGLTIEAIKIAYEPAVAAWTQSEEEEQYV
jgi:predicted naringenin-chalcone synthase